MDRRQMRGWLQAGQAIIAPIATPLAPATFLGNGVYKSLIAEEMVWWLALSVAIATVLGAEATGALGFYMAMRSWQKKRLLAFLLATGASIVYLTIIIWGILTLPNGRIIAILAAITGVAYLVAAIYFADRAEVGDREAEVEVLQAKKNLVNAETRRLKAGTVPTTVPTVPGTAGTGRNTPERQKVFDELDRARATGEELPGVNELARRLEIGKATASRHRRTYVNRLS